MAAATTIFEGDIEGARATASAHRKVELQAPADLTYLVSNVSRAARAKIDTHLPPDAAPESGEDALRRRVEVLVEEYIRKTFEGAKEGISVNGMDVGEMEEVLARVGEGEGESCMIDCILLVFALQLGLTIAWVRLHTVS